MREILQLVAEHDVVIGLAGTALVVLAVVAGFGRHHRRGTDTRLDRPE